MATLAIKTHAFPDIFTDQDSVAREQPLYDLMEYWGLKYSRLQILFQGRLCKFHHAQMTLRQ